MLTKFEIRLARSRRLVSASLILSCFQLCLGLQATARAQTNSDSLFYSEAPFVFENGVKRSNALTVKFKDRVIDLPQGMAQASPEQIDPSFSTLIKFFNDLESKYQGVALHNQIPSAVWADTIRISRLTGIPVKIHDMSQLFTVKFSRFVPIDSIIQILEKLPGVKYVHQPIQAIFFAQPNDPNYPANQWYLTKINAATAWDVTTGSSNISVGVIDAAGVKRTHEDFTNADGTSQFIVGKGDVTYNPNDSHGTEVAGVVAAATNNNKGIASLGWNIKMVPYQWNTVNGEDGNLSNIINTRIIQDGVKIITMSFSTGEYRTTPCSPNKTCFFAESYQTVEDAIANALAQDVVVLASTGNGSNNIGQGRDYCGECDEFPYTPYPAVYSGVIGVSATDENDVFISGYNSIPNLIDVVAPGKNILTTKNTGYITVNGTSFSAPLVTALAGLILSINPALTPPQVQDIITSTAVDLGTPGRDDFYGYGRINAYQALLMAHAYQNKSVSATATAQNNGRRLVKTSDGKYHLIFESGITSGGNVLSEIFYRRSNVGGTSWDPPIRLSAGNEQNRYSSIAERSGKLYVVWQRKTGASTYDILFRYFNGTSWNAIQTVTRGVSVANDPFPVIASPNTSELMVVYRSGNNLEWKRSTNDGGAWPTSGTIDANGDETLNSPSVGATIIPWGARRTGLAYATKEIPNASHIITRYHDGSAWSSSNNISSSLPGSLSQHAHPSLAPSGDATSPWYVHIAWDAYEYGNRVIIHRLASTADRNFGSQYYQLHYQTEDRPSISGLAGNTAHMGYNRGTNFYHLNAHFNGSGWSVQFPAISGFHPALSVGNPSAKYVWTDGAGSPYTINLSASSFQKPAHSDSAYVDYHRSVAVVDTITGAWFDVRVEGMIITTTSGTKSAISLIDVDPSSVITPANAFDGLSSQSIVMPATAESLIVCFAISGDKLSAVKNGVSPLRVEVMIVEKSGNITNVPVFLTNVENLPKTKRNIALAASAFADKKITLKPQVTGIATKSSFVASLGHIYEIIDSPSSKNVKKIADTATRQDFALKAYPNPFNPSTQIHFLMKADGLVTLHIYNLHGQLVRAQLNEHRVAGEHIVLWAGRDGRGAMASSGVYFVRFEAGNEVKIGQIMLVR